MAVEDLINVAPEIVLELGKIGKWIQAVGLIVVAWIIFQIINYYLNRKRMKMLEEFRKDIKRIEKKIDKLGKKR